MVDEEKKNNAGRMECGGGAMGWSGDAVNGFAIGVENGAVGNGNSRGSSSEGFRTYKRRRHDKRSSSGIKALEDGKFAIALVTQLLDKVSHPMLGAHAIGLGNCPLNCRRNIVLEQLYQSLCESEGGLLGCIQDALLFHPGSGCRSAAKGSVNSCEDNGKCPSQTGWMVNRTHNAAKGQLGVISNGLLSKSTHANADLCRRAFFDTVMSEKFAQLCSLLLENFPGTKVDRILEFGPINSRMKEGTYEKSPVLFHSDMQQLWTKLQEVGTEMVVLAKSLSDKSTISYHEQVGGIAHRASDNGKAEFLSGEPDLHTKPEQTEASGLYKICACRHCGERADGKDCLICDSCEEMYHVSCIEPALEVIPSKSWYCANCTANGIGSPHEKCAVCEKLNACRPPNDRVGDDVLSDKRMAFPEFKENSNAPVEHTLQFSKGGENFTQCNVCGGEIDNDGKFRVCGHPFCLHKYYHVRCLTSKQLSTYGPHWYCPSCLCTVCLTDRDDEKIVLCDGCDHAYHIYCMQPPRTSIPKGNWFCTKCDSGVRRICKAKRVYENIQYKLRRGEDGKAAFENLENARNDKCEVLVHKSGGVNMILSAAKSLNSKENMASIDMRS